MHTDGFGLHNTGFLLAAISGEVLCTGMSVGISTQYRFRYHHFRLQRVSGKGELQNDSKLYNKFRYAIDIEGR
jgi:hypothetical protein